MVLGTAVAGLTCLADVTSANIVGYTGNTLVAGKYNFISVPFAGLNELGTQKITEALKGEATWCPGEGPDDADCIKIWDPIDDYTTYYWWTDDSHQYDGWYNMAGDYFDDDPKNADGLEAGWSAWFLSRGNTAPQVTTSGAVESSDDVQIEIYEGCYNLIANPFPVRFQPNSDQPWWVGEKQVDWGAILAGDDPNTADCIKVWDPINDYSTYYYWEDDSHEYDGWYNMAGDFFEQVSGNENGMKVGEVFWYLSHAPKGGKHKITFYSPLAK